MFHTASFSESGGNVVTSSEEFVPHTLLHFMIEGMSIFPILRLIFIELFFQCQNRSGLRAVDLCFCNEYGLERVNEYGN